MKILQFYMKNYLIQQTYNNEDIKNAIFKNFKGSDYEQNKLNNDALFEFTLNCSSKKYKGYVLMGLEYYENDDYAEIDIWYDKLNMNQCLDLTNKLNKKIKKDLQKNHPNILEMIKLM